MKKFDPTKMPEMNAFGKFVDPVVSAGKTAVGKILDIVDTPQNALQGLIAEGGEGFKKGMSREKDYSSTDVLSSFGWEGDGLGKKAVGLGLDIVADPLNLLGVGAVKNAVAKGAKALKVGDALHSASKLPGIKHVGQFIDPHYNLRDTKGLKDFARLTESEARSIQNIAHEDVASVVGKQLFSGKNIPAGQKAGALVKTADENALRRIAYAIDENKMNTLTADEVEIANKFRTMMDDQWAREVNAGLQDPGQKLANYVPYVTKPDNQRNVSIISDVRGTTRHAKDRTLKSLQDAVTNHNATDNLADILQARLTSGRIAEHGANALEEAGRKFGSTIQKPKHRKLNEQFLRVTPNRGTVAKSLYYPEDVANYLERAHAIYNKPDDVGNAWKNAVKLYKSWLVTNPQQGATNLLGNVINAYMSGNERVLLPQNLARAGKVVGSGVAPDIGRYKGNDIVNAMRKWEVVGGQGQYQDIFEKGKNYSLNPFKTNNLASKGSQYVNQHYVEEPFKVALFLDQLEQGKSLEDAALAAKNTFFDYAEISDSAKAIRDYGLAPFITWQLKNIPMQLENLALRPQKFAQTESVYDAFTNDNTPVPHQDEREGMLPIQENKLMRFANPINDLNKLPIGDYEGRDFLVDTIGGSVPWIKGPIELATNKKIYNNQPIWREGQEGAVPFDFISKTADNLGLGSLVGISEDASGYPKQDELMAYVLQQNPWEYYRRNLMNPPQELVDRGSIGATTPLDRVAGAFGFRTKTLTPKNQINELKRKYQLLAP